MDGTTLLKIPYPVFFALYPKNADNTLRIIRSGPGEAEEGLSVGSESGLEDIGFP